jgi:hypothetical protein
MIKLMMTNKCASVKAILMAMQTRWSNARGIAQCSKSSATLDAPGSHYQAILAPYRPGGRQGNNQQNGNQTIH